MRRAPYDPNSFSSYMTRREGIAVLVYLPLHLWLIPIALLSLPQTASLSTLAVNIVVYTSGTLYMLLFAGRFLRRDFDPLCDHPVYCIIQIALCYCMMLACNMVLNSIFLALVPDDTVNPNNSAVMELAELEYGKTAALAIFLAPLVEEPIFRGAIFGFLRRKSRVLGYAVSMLLFAVYHVWGYAFSEPIYWLYMLQYLPVSWLLCRCYERCNSIWGSIFLHMTVNAISIYALSALADLMARCV